MASSENKHGLETTVTQNEDLVVDENEVTWDYGVATAYANALSKVVSQTATPKAIGVFASWESGRTYLLKSVFATLQRQQSQADLKSIVVTAPQSKQKFWIVASVFLIVAAALFVCDILLNVSDLYPTSVKGPVTMFNATRHNTTKSLLLPVKLNIWQSLASASLSLSAFLFVLSILMTIGARKQWLSSFTSLKLLLVGSYVKLPIYNQGCSVDSYDKDEATADFETNNSAKPTSPRYIFVNFNAAAYARSGTLWVGIISSLIASIEEEFGVICARLFRQINIETITPDVTTTEKNSNLMFVKVGSKDEQMKPVLQEFGVVQFYKKYAKWLRDDKKIVGKLTSKQAITYNNWSVVGYVNYTEMQNAMCYLLGKGIEAKGEDPYSRAAATTSSSYGSTEAQPLLKASRITQAVDQSKPVGFWQLLMSYPKTTGKLPLVFWNVLLIFVMIIPIPLSFAASWKSAAISSVAKGLAALPVSFLGSYGIIKFVYAMFKSQRKTVTSAAKLSALNPAVAAMETIKKEVVYLTQLIQCAEVTNNRKYKVIISIDDLGKVSADKILPVFEAIGLLLSTPSSPYICLLGIDQRVALVCIEKHLSQTLLNAHVSSHEYLKRIFPISFCLPQVVKKKKFLDRLMHMAGTEAPDVSGTHVAHPLLATEHVSIPAAAPSTSAIRETAATTSTTASTLTTNVSSGKKDTIASTNLCKTLADHTTDLTSQEFLTACRLFLQNNATIQNHLLSNPRNIKRIFNLTTVTAIVVDCIKTEIYNASVVDEVASGNSATQSKDASTPFPKVVRNQVLAELIVKWLILTEQWPYHMSYINVVVEQADQAWAIGKIKDGILDSTTIFEIYRTKVAPELPKLSADETKLLLQDGNVDMFYSFLEKVSAHGPSQRGLTKKDMKYLQIFSVNLDYSLRSGIAYQRSQLQLSQRSKEESAGKLSAI